MIWTAPPKALAKLAYRSLVGARLYELLEFRRHLGYWPDLEDPRTFNEKLCARKFILFPQAVMLSDKIAVREFVANRVGPEILTHVFYSGDCPASVDYPSLPSRFVIKGSHGSGPDLRALIWDKKLLSERDFIALGRRILRRRCGPETNELWYSHIIPRLIVEEMLLNADCTVPADFKFYVFGGVVHYIQVIAGRHDSPTSRFYDPLWSPQPFARGHFSTMAEFPRPLNLGKMIAAAELLGSSFEFARIDLYSVGERVVFGEISLTPGAGWIPFEPKIYDLVLGRHWSGVTKARDASEASQ